MFEKWLIGIQLIMLPRVHAFQVFKSYLSVKYPCLPHLSNYKPIFYKYPTNCVWNDDIENEAQVVLLQETV